MAAGAYIFSSGTLALVSAFHPSYVEQRWHLVLVYIAMLLTCFVMNVSGSSKLSALDIPTECLVRRSSSSAFSTV